MKGIIYDGSKAVVTNGLEVRAPGPRDVIVRVVAAGVCHSDISVIDGTIPWGVPVVLGHEGAGVVEQVGTAVTHVKPGDHCVIATLSACGLCQWCVSGQPTKCRATMGNMSQPFTLDGAPCNNFAGASVFTERTVVRDSQVVPISKDMPLTTACLIACGVVTGVGAVFNRANVQPGQTAAVYGCGGVGLNVLQALRVRRASVIVAIDTEPAKEALARQFGATHFFDGRDPDVIEKVRQLAPHSADAHAGPFNAGGLDWVFDVVAHPTVTANAMEMLTWGGNVVIVGVPGPGTLASISYSRLTHVDRGIMGCRYGTIAPQRDIPLIVDMYQRGELLLDELVSAVYPMEQFDDVVHAMHSGTLARGVLTMS
jgi:S-(hydroxymethyl)glutathione dehydrogenase/alcohol dehydrogenase